MRKNRDCPKSGYFAVIGTVPFFPNVVKCIFSIKDGRIGRILCRCGGFFLGSFPVNYILFVIYPFDL